ncbi:MAG: hypothetical protein APF81_22790 [Desulfosporosinus sp. BRH_c37]|nr:MAG: hypothetical protein APF81_22790 [Desulfosporosinus sp. BRH_c37]
MSKSVPRIQIPESKEKIMRQIKALEMMVKEDTNDHDRNIHETALNDLQKALKISQISESLEDYKQLGFDEMENVRVGIEHGVDVIFCDKPEFNRHQMREIERGLKKGVDVSIYTDPKFSWQQMFIIQNGLEKGVDVSIFAKVEFSQLQMELLNLMLSRDMDVSKYAMPEVPAEKMALEYFKDIGISISDHEKPLEFFDFFDHYNEPKEEKIE